MEIKKEDVIRYFKFLDHKSITELRPIEPRWTNSTSAPPSIFINNVESLIKAIERYNGTHNIYVGINTREKEGKEDSDVKWITNIGHDIDAHELGEDGKIIAGQIATEMCAAAIEQGLKEPLIIDSGRGYWVVHHIAPIENTEDNVKKIKEFGKIIKTKWERDGIELDSTVYNPSRIGRVPGTLNISDKDNFIISRIMNNPSGEEDTLLTEKILAIELSKYSTPLPTLSNSTNLSINQFMDYCLTHTIPKGERHRVISRNMAIYISDNPNRDLLKEQYIKIQGGSSGELDGWLKNIDEQGKDKFPFSIGELVNFTKKYKIPFDWKVTPEYQAWIKEQNGIKNLEKEIEKEKRAERLNKAIKFFNDKKHLAEQFLEIQPLFFDKAKLWWIWNDTMKFWEMCDETDIMNYISDHSEADTISSSEKNEILEALRQVSRKQKPKTIPSSWIQFKDYIVDINTDERMEVTKDYFVTNPIPWEIGSKEDTPVMDKIFEEWVGKDRVRTLYEILAYCLLNGYPIHRIFCFIGSGMNGKSKFLELLRKFVGETNCCSTELDVLLASRFEVTRLHNKLVCQMGETNFGELSKTSLLKKLSGGDLIGFEYKNKNPFEEINKAKIIISTNNLPATTDKTIGFYRRWMIIDFPNRFSEKKDILADIPEEEYNNLGLKCCSILKELLKIREFTNEGTIEERIEKYEARSNFLEQFLKEFTKEDFTGYITKSDFFKKFSAWCKEHRHREMSETSLGMAMKKIGILDGKQYFQWMNDGKGGQARVWESIIWQ